MNFKKLQAMQLQLDHAILAEKAPMTADERFDKTLAALSVEIAEVANTVEHFKFWKDNKGKVDSKRFLTGVDKTYYDTVKLEKVTFAEAHKLTLVEECSDCLHFVLSLANQAGERLQYTESRDKPLTLESHYLYIQNAITIASDWFSFCKEIHGDQLLAAVLDYFHALGITDEELEQAYYDKNEINYERLANGY